MAWTKKTTGGGNFLKFSPGSAYEGIFGGATEKPSPFKPGTMIWDYRINIDGKDCVLSSSSEALKAVLPLIPVGTKVKIEMKSFGGRKIYDVFMEE
jgi:hypothetical protein